MEVSIWALPPEYKNTRTTEVVWYDWILKLWFFSLLVSWLRRLLRLELVEAEGPSNVPASVRSFALSRPSSWQISFSPSGSRLVVLMTNGGVDALCVRSLRDDFASARVVALPGAPARWGGRMAHLSWDAAGKHVAVALFDVVHVYRVKRSGAAVLRGTFCKLPDCGVAGVALAGSALSHALFVLLFDGRLVRLTLPAGVNGGVYDCSKDMVCTQLCSSDDWRPVCLAYHHERKLFVVGGVLKSGSAGAVAIYSATSLSSNDRVAKHEWSSWRDTSKAQFDACIVQVLMSPDGSQCLGVSSSGATFVLQCNVSGGPSWSPLVLPIALCTTRDWFDDDRIVIGSYCKAKLALVSVKDGKSEFLCERQPVACSQVTRAFKGRFFFLNYSHREYAAPQHITREKLLQLQRDSERANTFWGSLANSIHSYVSYFHLPTLNMRSGGGRVTTRDEFHVTVMFDSFQPLVLMEKLVCERRFDDALEIAERHSLPTDMVYRSRLESTAALSPAAAVENLNAIKDDDWVVAFCLNRISSSPDEARALLKIGLDRCRGDHIKHEASRILLQESGDRLETYLEATEGKFDGTDFFDFKHQDLVVSSIVHAMHGRAALVSIFWKRHLRQLQQFQFAILNSFPETVSCSEYVTLLPNKSTLDVADTDMAGSVIPSSLALRQAVVEGSFQLDGDWIPFLRSLLFPKDQVRVMNLEFRPRAALKQSTSEWFVERALVIDDECGQLDVVQELLSHAEPDEAVIELQHRVEEVVALVYKQHQTLCSLRSYVALSVVDRFAMFFASMTKENVVQTLNMTRNKFFANDNFALLLRQFVCRCARDGSPALLSVMELVFSQSSPAVVAEARPFLDPAQFMESVLEASRLSARPEDLVLWRRVLSYVPTRASHLGHAELLAMHDQLDVLESQLDALEVLARLGSPVSLAKIQHLEFASVLASVKRSLHRGCSDWTGLLRDLLLLQSSLFSKSVSSEEIHGHYVSFLIAAKQPVERVLRSCDDCGELASRFVVTALDQIFDGCNGLDSPELAYVASLLKHFPSKQLGDLMNVAELLHGVGVQMIPLQLRVWKNQTSADVFGRVCSAISRSNVGQHQPLSDDSCRLVCRLLSVPEDVSALASAFGESDLKHGRMERAVETALSQKNSRLAAKCLEDARLSWPESVALASLVAASGDFGSSIKALEQKLAKWKPKQNPAKQVAELEFDPLLDQPIIVAAKQPIAPSAQVPVEENVDDIAGIAKKAWSSFFGSAE